MTFSLSVFELISFKLVLSFPGGRSPDHIHFLLSNQGSHSSNLLFLLWLIHSIIHWFIHQIFIQHPPYARDFVWNWDTAGTGRHSPFSYRPWWTVGKTEFLKNDFIIEASIMEGTYGKWWRYILGSEKAWEKLKRVEWVRVQGNWSLEDWGCGQGRACVEKVQKWKDIEWARGKAMLGESHARGKAAPFLSSQSLYKCLVEIF